MSVSTSRISGSRSLQRGWASLCFENTLAHMRLYSFRMKSTLEVGRSWPSMVIAEVGGAVSPLNEREEFGEAMARVVQLDAQLVLPCLDPGCLVAILIACSTA